MIISGCLIMGCCILIGFLIGQFFGIAKTEQRVLKEIEKSPSIQLIHFGERVFGNSQTIKIKPHVH